jgi:hypothetical protein
MKKIFYLNAISMTALLMGVTYAQGDQSSSTPVTSQPSVQSTHVTNSGTKPKKAKKSKTKASKTASTEGDGLSFETAVVIQAKTEGTGEDEEYAWIAQHYPSYKRDRQTLTENKNHPYDIITIITKEGEKMDLIFDISNFFGKY